MDQEMDLLLGSYLEHACVSISRTNEVTSLNVVKEEGLIVVEVIVPHDVLEWFVAVRNENNKEIVGDWLDHYQVAGETQKQLAQERRTEIRHFLDAIVGSAVRLAPRHKRPWLSFWSAKNHRVLEIRSGNEWKQIVPFEDWVAK